MELRLKIFLRERSKLLSNDNIQIIIMTDFITNILSLDGKPTSFKSTQNNPQTPTLLRSSGVLAFDEVIVPKFIFIIPYRNRQTYLEKFIGQMTYILEDIPSSHYKILVIHQSDRRIFNRGAIKNVGFLYVKNLYPNDYKTITLVFNDVDTFPLNKNYIDYTTRPGIVKHFFGFKYALGGIVSITGGDFEKINGYPNLWTWGYEDNMIQVRVSKARLLIDRTNFYDLSTDYKNDTLYACINSGVTRIISKNEYIRFAQNTPEGISHIRNIRYDILENDIPPYIEFDGISEESNPVVMEGFKNTIHAVGIESCPHPYNKETAIAFTVVNITHFNTLVPSPTDSVVHNLLVTNTPFYSFLSKSRNPTIRMML